MRSSVAPEGDRHPAAFADCPRSSSLRSSVAPEGDRHGAAYTALIQQVLLRSSVAPEGDRHVGVSPRRRARRGVAILGRPGGRPPQQAVNAVIAAGVAILGRPGGRPPRRRSRLRPDHRRVAILGRPGGRPPLRLGQQHAGRRSRCDPRSPRRATATRPAELKVPVIALLRSSVAPEGDRHSGSSPVTSGLAVTLRSSVAPEGDRHARERDREPRVAGVAILGRPGGRPPRELGSGNVSESGMLRSSVAPEGDRHPWLTSRVGSVQSDVELAKLQESYYSRHFASVRPACSVCACGSESAGPLFTGRGLLGGAVFEQCPGYERRRSHPVAGGRCGCCRCPSL